MKQSVESLFLQLIRIACGNAVKFTSPVSAEEWEDLMNKTEKHGITGVAFDGVEKLPKEHMPPLSIIMKWTAYVDCKERRSVRLNRVSVNMSAMFERDGKNACIIKGASVGCLYPNPHRRDVGDVDVWMAGGYDNVSEYVRKKFAKVKGAGGGHHLSVVMDGVSVEVHFMPAELYNFWHNRYLKVYYKEIEAKPWRSRIRLETGDFIVPEIQVSLVIVIVHLFHHWAFEGIGMKQVLDCYWVLKRVGKAGAEDSKGMDCGCRKRADEIRNDTMALFERIGIDKFVAALMYVLCQIGMDEDDLLCVPNVKYGQRLLDDIFVTGVVWADDLLNGKYGRESKLHKFCRRFCRVVRIMPMAPSELPCMLLKNVLGWMSERIVSYLKLECTNESSR